MVEQGLMAFFKFDSTDLQANKDGRLTPRQSSLLLRRDRILKVGGYASAAACMLASLWLAIRVATLASADWASTIDWGLGLVGVWPLVCGGAIGVLFLAGAALALLFQARRSADFSLLTVRGPVRYRWKIEPAEGQATIFRFMEVHGMRFQLRRGMQAVLPEGQEFEIHFVAHRDGTGEILSVESIRP